MSLLVTSLSQWNDVKDGPSHRKPGHNCVIMGETNITVINLDKRPL